MPLKVEQLVCEIQFDTGRCKQLLTIVILRKAGISRLYESPHLTDIGATLFADFPRAPLLPGHTDEVAPIDLSGASISLVSVTSYKCPGRAGTAAHLRPTRPERQPLSQIRNTPSRRQMRHGAGRAGDESWRTGRPSRCPGRRYAAYGGRSCSLPWQATFFTTGRARAWWIASALDLPTSAVRFRPGAGSSPRRGEPIQDTLTARSEPGLAREPGPSPSSTRR